MKKIKSIGFACLYVAMPIVIQLVMALLLNIHLIMIQFRNRSISLQSVIDRFQNDYGYNLILVTLCNLVLIMGMGSWYWFIRRRQECKRGRWKKVVSPKSLLCMFALAVCGQFAANVIMLVFALTMPNVFEQYTKLMEGISLDVLPAWAMIFIVVIWAPLAEELIFRGMVFRTLRKGFRFLPAALLSGVAFGLYHGNLVQGAYAGLLGIVLAYIYEKTESLLGCYLFHFFFNLTNYGISAIQEQINLPQMILGLIILVLDVLSVFGMVGLLYAFSRIYKKDADEKKTQEITEEHLQK